MNAEVGGRHEIDNIIEKTVSCRKMWRDRAGRLTEDKGHFAEIIKSFIHYRSLMNMYSRPPVSVSYRLGAA
jgi:hypothetical protein